MRINEPNPLQILLKGYIILEYKGKDAYTFNRITYRNAELMLRYKGGRDSSQKELIFTIDFQEFYGIAMQMDFAKSIIRAHARGDDFLSDVGTIQLESICADEQSFVVTGQYTHESISLAYHDDDIVNFQVCFDIRNSKPRFNHKRILETLQRFPHLNCVTSFY